VSRVVGSQPNILAIEASLELNVLVASFWYCQVSAYYIAALGWRCEMSCIFFVVPTFHTAGQYSAACSQRM